MFERFTKDSIKTIMLAQEEGRRLGHNFVSSEQILLGLIGEGGDVAARSLDSIGVRLKNARVEVEKTIGRGNGPLEEAPPFVDDAKRILELSWEEAQRLRHNYIATEHLLLGILRKRNCVAVKIMEELGVNFDELERQVLDGAKKNRLKQEHET